MQIPQLVISSSAFAYDSFLLKNLDAKNNETSLPNSMLGKQAEALFEIAISASERYKIIAANMQVKGVFETLGELDYIVLNTQNNELIHIELACKFYLFDETIEGVSAAKWIGPNRKDTLEDKLIKLQQKQFPLLYKKETVAMLKRLGIDTSEVLQQLCLQSQLFIPKEKETKEFTSAYQDCIVGYWIRYSEFLSEDKKASYSLPTKREWLLPAEELSQWQSYDDTKTIISTLINKKRSPFVYKKMGDKIDRFFVVWWS
jgi:hypothetical protein